MLLKFSFFTTLLSKINKAKSKQFHKSLHCLQMTFKSERIASRSASRPRPSHFETEMRPKRSTLKTETRPIIFIPKFTVSQSNILSTVSQLQSTLLLYSKDNPQIYSTGWAKEVYTQNNFKLLLIINRNNPRIFSDILKQHNFAQNGLFDNIIILSHLLVIH